MLMSVPREICVRAEFVLTQRDPIPAPGVRLAIECLQIGRGVKVMFRSSCAHLFKNTCLLTFDQYALFMLLNVCACVYVLYGSDIDECQSLSTCTNGICLNTEGSYICENCPTGYRVSYDGELCEGRFSQKDLRYIVTVLIMGLVS